MVVLRSDLRAADYRLKAEQALAAADGSCLDQVRRRHEAAAAVWNDLAQFEDRRSATVRAVADS
jgi:hypothetical protein